MTDMFNTMRVMMLSQAELIYNQSALMQERLGLYFRYFKDEISTIKDVKILKEILSLPLR
jgi:hypothetical protein